MTERMEADIAILAAVVRNERLLPGQRAALQRIHDALSARATGVIIHDR